MMVNDVSKVLIEETKVDDSSDED